MGCSISMVSRNAGVGGGVGVGVGVWVLESIDLGGLVRLVLSV